VIIPAYQPAEPLVQLIASLQQKGISRILVIDDGSKAGSEAIFSRLLNDYEIEVITHPCNLGKGAAIKTGLIHIWGRRAGLKWLVTADADGQHTAECIEKFIISLNKPNALYLGSRLFDEAKVPLRSRFGNALTQKLLHFFTGLSLEDTQTGLRAIPISFVPSVVGIPENRYEFELEMLLMAHRNGLKMISEPIPAIYIDDNQSSHFNPILDSIRIYFVLFRFVFISIFSGIADTGCFLLLYYITGIPSLSTFFSRLASGYMNFHLNKRYVFRSHESTKSEIVRYAALALVLMTSSYLLLEAFVRNFGMKIVWAKISAEALLFLVSFAIQRIFVFAKTSED
jgi:glycosyltransferase involved in cell wall biosynthesis